MPGYQSCVTSYAGAQGLHSQPMRRHELHVKWRSCTSVAVIATIILCRDSLTSQRPRLRWVFMSRIVCSIMRQLLTRAKGARGIVTTSPMMHVNDMLMKISDNVSMRVQCTARTRCLDLRRSAPPAYNMQQSLSGGLTMPQGSWYQLKSE